jgi:anthranilate synthase component 1
MYTNLFNRLYDLKKEGKNFAYFCKFTDKDRIMGKEILIEGEEVIESEDSHILDNVTEPTPFILSFALVNSIFKSKAKEGIFPHVLMLKPISKEEGEFKRTTAQNHYPLREQYKDLEMEGKISTARSRIRNGELLQVVISKEFGPLKVDPLEVLNQFLENDRSLYVFYYKFNNYELFGSSPENLVTRSGDDLMIEPIAGTRTVSTDAEKNILLEKELLSDPKELLEHRMLVDLARNDLGKISVMGSVNVSLSMRVRRFSSLMHIVSQVTSKIDSGVKNSQIIDAVFPAGTVSGAPKDRAIRVINELEDTPRGPYAGSVGLVEPKNMDMALTIRSIYSQGKGYFVRSGGGIVKDSVPETEVNEIRMKSYSAAGGRLNEITAN